jgi:hypothetical protein
VNAFRPIQTPWLVGALILHVVLMNSYFVYVERSPAFSSTGLGVFGATGMILVCLLCVRLVDNAFRCPAPLALLAGWLSPVIAVLVWDTAFTLASLGDRGLVPNDPEHVRLMLLVGASLCFVGIACGLFSAYKARAQLHLILRLSISIALGVIFNALIGYIFFVFAALDIDF